ncbi:MAG: hypothetical protein NDI75_08600 [Candidatus Didemnitutus sp.]|nr:hypothetical protein [Candidatus Didemnitutus sp.]
MFALDEARTKDLLALPESGMGYQLIEFVTDDARRHYGFAVNAEYVLGTEEPRALLRESRRLLLAKVQLVARERGAVIRELTLVDRHHQAFRSHFVSEAQARYSAKVGPAKDAPIVQTKLGEIFVRFSAFANDRRINPDKSLQPGTYATTEADARLVRTGIEAVRRYALPNPDPAVNRFTLLPPKPAAIQYGIVEPANGQPGGGVEVIFPNGTAAGTVVHQDTIPPF